MSSSFLPTSNFPVDGDSITCGCCRLMKMKKHVYTHNGLKQHFAASNACREQYNSELVMLKSNPPVHTSFLDEDRRMAPPPYASAPKEHGGSKPHKHEYGEDSRPFQHEETRKRKLEEARILDMLVSNQFLAGDSDSSDARGPLIAKPVGSSNSSSSTLPFT